MVEDTLQIEWANRDQSAETRKYWVTSNSYDPAFTGDPEPRTEIVGQEAMLVYLIGIQRETTSFMQRAQVARRWLLQIHNATGLISLEHALVY